MADHGPAVERAWEDVLVAELNSAGVRHRRLSADEHRRREADWRASYGRAFGPGLRHKHGERAVHEYLNQPAGRWMLVPFLSNLPGLPIHVLPLRLSAFECDGPPVGLGDFSDAEFFVAPPDFAWTFVRTHEDFALGGPYFVRAEWLAPATAVLTRPGRRSRHGGTRGTDAGRIRPAP